MSSPSSPTVASYLRSGGFVDLLRAFMPVAALAVVVSVFGLLDQRFGQGRFLSTANFSILLSQSSFITVASLGMMLVIAVGGIDLSAGAILGLGAAAVALWLKATGPETAEGFSLGGVVGAVPVAIGVGAICGFANGAVISTFRLAPFIVTLGSMAIFLGLALVLCDEKTVTPDLKAVPEWLRNFVSMRRPKGSAGFSLPWGIPVELLLAAGIAFMLRKTPFGRHLLAVGANETAAKLCGIRVERVRIAVYTLAGSLFGLAGLYQFALVRNYSPKTGQGMELDIIAAVVIGGAGLDGGRATVIGTLVGSLLMAVIRSGCTQLSVPPPYQQIVIGSIIVAAVLFDRLTARRRG